MYDRSAALWRVSDSACNDKHVNYNKLTKNTIHSNVLAFYSSTIYCVAGGKPPSEGTYLTPLFLSWGIGLTNFLFAFPAYWLIDRKGRRWLLLTTIPFLALTLLAAALSFMQSYPESMRAPVIGLFTYLFMAFYSWGLGPGK